MQHGHKRRHNTIHKRLRMLAIAFAHGTHEGKWAHVRADARARTCTRVGGRAVNCVRARVHA
eukprot:2232454-Alexandrium_andersonii.AAC.1